MVSIMHSSNSLNIMRTQGKIENYKIKIRYPIWLKIRHIFLIKGKFISPFAFYGY